MNDKELIARMPFNQKVAIAAGDLIIQPLKRILAEHSTGKPVHSVKKVVFDSNVDGNRLIPKLTAQTLRRLHQHTYKDFKDNILNCRVEWTIVDGSR